ncbi:DegV family protein [Mesoaciditoga sp.]
MKIKILVDSTADIKKEWLEAFDAELVPLKVIWSDGSSEDDERDPEALKDFYNRLRNSNEIPKTSQPTVFEFLQRYRNAEQEGYEGVVVITLSSRMSGTTNSAATAAKEASIPVEVFDTKLASSVNALVVRRARELAEEGRSPKEIVEILQKERNEKRFQALFYVSDFNYLVRGGRVSRFQGFLGTMFKIKVGIWIDYNGDMIPFDKVRGRSKAYDLLLEKVKNEIPFDSKVRLAMIHADAEEEARELLERIKMRYNVVDESFHRTGKVITTHVGPGMCGFGIERID